MEVNIARLCTSALPGAEGREGGCGGECMCMLDAGLHCMALRSQPQGGPAYRPPSPPLAITLITLPTPTVMTSGRANWPLPSTSASWNNCSSIERSEVKSNSDIIWEGMWGGGGGQ